MIIMKNECMQPTVRDSRRESAIVATQKLNTRIHCKLDWNSKVMVAAQILSSIVAAKLAGWWVRFAVVAHVTNYSTLGSLPK